MIPIRVHSVVCPGCDYPSVHSAQQRALAELLVRRMVER